LRSRLHLDHLYLRIPVEATTSAPAILAEDLGRLNRFSGVIVSDARDASTEVFVRRLRYHQPTLRVGVLNGTVAMTDAEFVLREITATAETDAVEREARKWLSRNSEAWFLVQRDAGTEGQLRGALVALRRAGAPHFGYGPDDFLAGRPRASDIVSTLLAHTVVRHVD
jgi:hypothetical protein